MASSSGLAPAALRRRLAGVGPQGFGGRAGWASIVEVLQLASSVLVFLILARLLETDDYGVMGGVLAMAATTASLSNFGSHVLLIKRSAQGHDLADAWRRATTVGFLGPLAGTIVLIGLRPVIVPDVDPWVYGLLVVSQLNFFWLTELAVFLGNGTRRLKEAAQLRLIVLGCRFAALLTFAIVGGGNLLFWAGASVVSFGVAAVASLVFVWRVFGLAPSFWTASRTDIIEGFPFAANSSTESLVDVSDRPLLLRYDHQTDAGIYSLGGRIIQFGYLPMRIVLRASDADMFEAGKHGVRPALRVTRSLLGIGVAIGVSVGIGIAICAPLVPILVGDKYAEAVTTMRLLAVLPAIRAVQYLMGNCLSVSDHQWWRVGATLGAGVLNLGLNLWLLPDGGWRTAVFTTIVSELFLAAALWIVVHALAWREKADAAELAVR